MTDNQVPVTMSDKVPTVTDTHVGASVGSTPDLTWVHPENETTDLLGAVSDSFTIVLSSLVKALEAIFTNAGVLLVLIIAGLGFMFVYWAIRLIHLRGR